MTLGDGEGPSFYAERAVVHPPVPPIARGLPALIRVEVAVTCHIQLSWSKLYVLHASWRPRGDARFPGYRRPQGRDHGPARRAVRTPSALYVRDQRAEVLPDRRAAADQGRAGGRADLPGARLAPGGLRGPVRPGPGRNAARRVDSAVRVRPGRDAPDPRHAPERQADRDRPRPGGARPLQLDPPVVRGPGASRRLRPGLRRGGAPDRGGLGQLLALHRARPLRRAARVPVHALPS
jgi:hypothetical protein